MYRCDIINSFIKKYNYKTYLEIGVRIPSDNFDKIDIAVKEGVDPNPIGDVTHKMTSDNFFNNNSKTFDIIFIDGLHLAEQVEKDILNSLYFLNKGGTIVIHDCNPIQEFHQRENYEVDGTYPAWNGTVWKAYVSMRMKLFKREMYVVNTDHGCGVIRDLPINSDYKQLRSIESLKYKYLEKNRTKLLNLISIDDFKKRLSE